MSPRHEQCPTCGAQLAAGLCRQCLLRVGLGSAPAMAGANWFPPAPEELEAQLRKYRVVELIGRGGMGAVYKGWQTSLERDVAIKVLPPAVLEEDFTARFKQEARTMARLSHPAIVSVYEFDETDDGLCYIVMEFIDGTDVQRMIASEGKLPIEHALAISINVCGALSYAHEHGVIHRDIKPANVMVDTEGRVKVADFGLARVAQPGAALLTGTNVAMGTPGYVAPEVLNASMTADARADVYAVGVMLYAMLTGKVPHGRFEAAAELVPGLDPRFDAIVNRAMQADREARYGNAGDLRTDLTSILTGTVDQASARFAETVSSSRSESRPTKSTPARTGAFAREQRPSSGGSRIRARAALAGLAAVACGVGLFAWKPWSHRVDQTAAAVPPASHGNAMGSAASLVNLPASISHPFVNSLGMKFVPVPITGGPTNGKRVLFSVWDTRVQDYEIFAKATLQEWPKPTFPQGPTHPAVEMSWEDVQLFCRWLTQREQAAQRLPAGFSYRLPSDHEWSCAVGLGLREDAATLPKEKNSKSGDLYPWGSRWPPPAGVGNYAGEEMLAAIAAGKHTHLKSVLIGYRDGFVETAPVGSFAANQFGLFDMGGNVWQWCEDWYDRDQKRHVLRGASWDNDGQSTLLSRSRFSLEPGTRHDIAGFRCVLAPEPLPTGPSKWLIDK